jgi:hypothetical protein
MDAAALSFIHTGAAGARGGVLRETAPSFPEEEEPDGGGRLGGGRLDGAAFAGLPEPSAPGGRLEAASSGSILGVRGGGGMGASAEAAPRSLGGFEEVARALVLGGADELRPGGTDAAASIARSNAATSVPDGGGVVRGGGGAVSRLEGGVGVAAAQWGSPAWGSPARGSPASGSPASAIARTPPAPTARISGNVDRS